MTEATIWSPDFFRMGATFLPWGIGAISIFVFGAKGTKPYEFMHLFCGLFLIFFGMATLSIALMNKSLMATLAEQNAMTKDAKELGEMMWVSIQLSVPLLSFAFGTRFVGNWVSTERPAGS